MKIGEVEEQNCTVDAGQLNGIIRKVKEEKEEKKNTTTQKPGVDSRANECINEIHNGRERERERETAVVTSIDCVKKIPLIA